jgi:DNA polymerase
MGELRTEVRSLHGIPVVPTYHPAYLLRNPSMKRAAWEDLCKVRDLLKG